MVAIYTVLVGGDAAVVQAVLMGGLALYSRQLGSRQDSLNSLGFVATLMGLALTNETHFNSQFGQKLAVGRE